MQVWGFRDSEIADAAETVGVEIRNFRKNGRGYSFTLGLAPSKQWQKLSPDPWESTKAGYRRTASVCWHGHYAFMRELFRFNENGRVKATRLADLDYRGLLDFLAKAEATGDINVGSIMFPALARETCACEDD